MRSPSRVSPSMPIGSSRDTGSRPYRRISITLSGVTSIATASSVRGRLAAELLEQRETGPAQPSDQLADVHGDPDRP